MDIITLSLAKKYANKVAAGFSNVEVQGNNLIFTLNDGTKATMTVPTPEKGSDGISVVDLSIDTDGSLLCHMSDETVINAGIIPTFDKKYVDDNINKVDNKIVSTRNELERVKNDVLETGTDIDTFIHLEDSAMAEYQELSVDGVCKQDTTSGSNLCNLNVVQDSRVVYNSDGTITINGAGGFTLAFKQFTAKANTKYYIKWELVSGTVDTSKSSGNSFLSPFSNANLKQDVFTESVVENDKNIDGFWINNMAVFINAVIRIWFSETQSPFEPYTGGQPSPSPDYPQPISTIENSFKITSCNKNIWDENWNLGGIGSSGGDYNGSTSSIRTQSYISIKENKKYYVLIPNSTKCFVFYYDKDKKYLKTTTINLNSYKGSATALTNARYLRIAFTNEYGNTYNNDIIISYEDTPYEQHLETQIEANLPEGEFIGKINDTYKDTLKVEYNAEDGQYHLNLYKNIGKVVLDGSEKWNYQNNAFTTLLNDIKITNSYEDRGTYLMISNYFLKGKTNYRDDVQDLHIAKTIDSNGTQIGIKYSEITSVDDFKTWLSTHNTEVYYALETPYILDLGIVDMPITYNEVTNLFTDSDLMPQINAKYYRTFEKTIQNLQVNEKALKQELVDINARLSALESASTSVISESEVTE